jgi:capsular exopolysaccharide synthesis family protein
LIYGVAVFLSLSLGFGILLIKYLTFNEISHLSELQKILPEGIGVLGAIPLTSRKMTHSQLLVSEAPKSRVSESFRTIRTNLSFVKKNVRTIAVTSSISGEGKTFVALNLAGIIAMSGKKVVVIDLDMRKPKIHLGFQASNAKGMSNLLAGHYSLTDVVKKSNMDNLYYISAGPIPPNPSELILSPQFDELIEKLKEEFDVIIIDNPPVGLVSDGVNVLSKVDVPIFIFKANYSKRHFITNLEEIAKPKEIKNLNIILNAELKSKNAYGYGYGGYYTDEEKRGLFKK